MTRNSDPEGLVVRAKPEAPDAAFPGVRRRFGRTETCGACMARCKSHGCYSGNVTTPPPCVRRWLQESVCLVVLSRCRRGLDHASARNRQRRQRCHPLLTVPEAAATAAVAASGTVSCVCASILLQASVRAAAALKASSGCCRCSA